MVSSLKELVLNGFRVHTQIVLFVQKELEQLV